MSKIFKTILYDQPPSNNSNAYPMVRNNWTIRRIANAPNIEWQNKWESAGNIRVQILGVTLLPFSSLGAIVALETSANPNKNVYWIMVGILSTCTNLDFMNMVVPAIRGWYQYMNCKHLYYLYMYFCKMDIHNDKLIHALSYSFNVLKLLLLWVGIITVPE